VRGRRQQGYRRRIARAQSAAPVDFVEPEWRPEKEFRALDRLTNRSRSRVDRRPETAPLARPRRHEADRSRIAASGGNGRIEVARSRTDPGNGEGNRESRSPEPTGAVKLVAIEEDRRHCGGRVGWSEYSEDTGCLRNLDR